MIEWQAPLAEPIADLIKLATEDLPGWPMPQREAQMAQLILDTRPNIVVELGVYGGRSLIPQSLALKYNGFGHIYGIDAWDAETVAKNAALGEDPITQKQLNIAYTACLDRIKELDLVRWATLLPWDSHEETEGFGNIDILNIDAGHSDQSSCRDVEVWLPRVRRGGFIWFDDVQWPSVKKALGMIEQHCEIESDQGLYRLYRKKRLNGC